MRRFALMLLLCLLTAAPARAQVGPPGPRAAAGGYSWGLGLENVNSTWMPYDYDVGRNRVYLEGTLGLNDHLEIFGRVGGSNWVINDLESFEPGLQHDVSSDGYPAFFSVGTRGRLWQCGKRSIGASLEGAFYSGMEDFIRWDHDVYQELYFDAPVEINAALSFGHQLGAGVVYAGPLLHFGYTRADVRTHEFGSDWDIEDDINALTIRDKAGWGALVGWQTPICSGCWRLQLEGALLRDGFGISVALWKRSACGWQPPCRLGPHTPAAPPPVPWRSQPQPPPDLVQPPLPCNHLPLTRLPAP